MARPFLLSALVARCRQSADLANADSIPDSEWKGWISTAYAELHSVLAESGLRKFESVLQIAVADLSDNGDNGGRVALPGDFLSCIGVDLINGDERTELCELMLQQRNLYSSATGGGFAEAFVLAGDDLILYPKPSQGSYELGYIPQPRDLSAESDSYSVDVVTPDGEAFIVWHVSVLALQKHKETEEARTAQVERERALERLQTWATLRVFDHRRVMVRDDIGEPYDSADYPRRRWGY